MMRWEWSDPHLILMLSFSYQCYSSCSRPIYVFGKFLGVYLLWFGATFIWSIDWLLLKPNCRYVKLHSKTQTTVSEWETGCSKTGMMHFVWSGFECFMLNQSLNTKWGQEMDELTLTFSWLFSPLRKLGSRSSRWSRELFCDESKSKTLTNKQKPCRN